MRKIVEWIDYEDAEDRKESIGGMGGFFKNGMRWKDYIDGMSDSGLEYAEAIRQSVIVNEIKKGGDWHQQDGEGVPLFDDGTVGTFSYRAWGDLLAAVWSEHEDEDYEYMDFYMEGFGKVLG